MAYKVIKGKNKIRGEQTFVDNITGSVISASAYYGATFTGETVSGSTGLFSVVSASAVLVNGSPISIDTGSLLITASIANDTITFTKGNSSTFPLTINNVVNAQTASYVETAQTASFYNTSSLLITSSILNDTITFTKGNGANYSLTVNNVSTSSYASNADLFDGRDSTTFAGTGSNTFNGNQIITGTLNVSSTISGTTALFTTITSSAITSSTLLSTNITGTYAQLLNISGTTAQYTTISGSQITGSNIKTTTLSASYISASQIALTEYLDFNIAGTTPAYSQGRLYYNVDTQDPSFYTSVTGVNINLGQQTAVKVKNSSGVSVTKGKLVHIVGGVGTNPLIATASWENDNNSANTLGMAMNDMNQNDFGFVLLNGVITGVNTQGFTAGQILYLSSSGNYTGTKPQAPLHAVKVGEVVTVQQNNGVIFVNINNGQEIEELHDVRITFASSGDLLTYSSYNGTPVWVNTKTLSGSYVITGSLTISSSATFTNIGPAIFSGTINTNNILSGTTAQFTTITATSITGSITTASYAQNADLFDNRDSTTFAGTGSNTFTGVQNFNQNITGTHAYFSGDIVINGTASIGMLETRNQQSLVVGDKYIVIMSGATDHTTLDGSGILYGSGATGPTVDENGANAYLRYRNAYDAIEVFPGFRVTGSLAVTNGSTFTTVSGTTAQFTSLTGSFSGSGANLNNIPNGALVNSSVTVGSTNISLGATATTIQGITVLTGSTVTGSTALFTTITASSISIADSSVLDVSSSNTALRITQRGTGESFRVEDSTNPDSTPFVIDSSGRVGIGTAIPNFNLSVTGNVGISGSTTITGSIDMTGSITINSGNIARVIVTNNTTTQGGEIILRSLNGVEFAKLRAAASTDGAELFGYNKIAFYQLNGSATNTQLISDKPIVWQTYSVQSPFTFGGFTGFGGEVRFINLQNNSSSLHVYNGDQIRASFPSGNVTIGKNVSTPYALDITGAVAITGTLNVGTGLYTSNTTTTVVGNNVIYNVATASYDGMFVDYTVRSGSNARAGQIMAIWSGSSVNYTETTTNDFGSTIGLAMAVVINGTNMQLSASASTANWTVKTIIRTI